MAAPEPIDQLTFVPYLGGLGKRLTATTSTASVEIPGMGVGQGKDGHRVMFTNGGTVAAFVRMGGPGVVATLDCYELAPGTTQSLGAPFTPNIAVWYAVITESGTTKISACAGVGI